MANFSDPTQAYQTGFDPNTGLFFYLNNITGETTWEEPDALRLPEGYQRGFDENTGRVYYGNVLTGEVSWEFPAFQQQANMWEVNVDSEGRTFYFNTITQQSQWDPPPELAQQPSTAEQFADPGRPASRSSSGSISRPGSKGRRRRRRRRTGTPGSQGSQDQTPLFDDNENPANWEVNQDDDGRTFYYNLVTGVTQWDEPLALQLPDGWVMEVDDASGDTFYFNDITGESSWERPMRQFDPSKRASSAGGGTSAVDPSQMTEKQIKAMDWEISKDGAGNPIYINIKTGEMLMEKPECLVSSEEDEDIDDQNQISAAEQALKEMTEDDWDLVRENSEVTSVWGDWETYVHNGKPDKYDEIQKKAFEKRVKEAAKEREKVLEVRAERLKETKKRREEEDKKAAKMTLRMKRELAKKREKEDQEEEKIQEEEDESVVPEPQRFYPPLATGYKFWYHIKDDRCTYEDPILIGWSDGSTDGEESTDAPSDYETNAEKEERERLEEELNHALEEISRLNTEFEDIENEEEKEGYEDAEGKDAEKKKDISTKIIELKNVTEEIRSKIKDVREAWIRALEAQENEEKMEEVKETDVAAEGGKKEESESKNGEKAKRVRRIKRRVPRKERYGDWRPTPKPPIRRTDKKVNRCFSHPQRFLDLSRQNIMKLPKRILSQTHTVVKHISFVGNSLKKITDEDINDLFVPMKDINVLDFNRNFLKQLPSDIFKLKSLRAISCGFNRLEGLPTSMFLLTNLTALSFNQNSIKELGAELGVQTMRNYKVWEINVGGLTNLTSLNFANNEFSTLPTHHESQQRDAQWGDLKALTALNFSVNKFEKLPNEEFSRLESLTDLNFNENLFETFPSSISELRCLEKLQIAYNRLNGVDENIGNLRLMRILILKNNHIEELPNSFRDCVSLEVLDLSYNDIIVLPDFGKLCVLQHLLISHNEIERLPDSFSGLKALEKLEASDNKIQWISPKIKSMKQITYIDLSNNQIEADGFPAEAFQSFRELQTMNLSRNKITELASGWGSALTNLQRLDLSYNLVDKVGYDICEMVSLTELNLYSNELTVLPSTIGNLPKLRTLNLGVNHLEDLPVEMKMLETLHGVLDLSDNNFEQRPDFVWRLKGLKHVIMSGNPLQVLSTSFTVHMVRADTAFGDGKYDEAIMHYTRVLDVDPKNIEAIGKRGMIYHRLGRTDDAIGDLTLAIDIEFQDPSLFYNRGMLYIQLEQPKKALFDFMQALDRSPDFKSAMLGQAEAYNIIGQFDTAIKKCEQALGDLKLFEEWKTSETVTKCLAVCGYSYLRRGQVPKALAMFDNLMERGYDNPRKIMLLRGMCFRDLDRHKDAIEAFTEIISFYDENPEKLDEGDGELVGPEEAKKSYRMALLNRSATYGAMNKEKLALKDYERVYKREPTEEILKLVQIEREKKEARLRKKKEDMARKIAEQNKRIEEQKAMMKKREQQSSHRKENGGHSKHHKHHK